MLNWWTQLVRQLVNSALISFIEELPVPKALDIQRWVYQSTYLQNSPSREDNTALQYRSKLCGNRDKTHSVPRLSSQGVIDPP